MLKIINHIIFPFVWKSVDMTVSLFMFVIYVKSFDLMLYLSLSRVCNLFPFLYQTVYGRGSPCILHLSFNFDFGPAFTVMDSTTGSSSFNLGGAEKKSTIKINWLILIFWSNHMNPTTQKLVKMKIKVTVLRNFFKNLKTI